MAALIMITTPQAAGSTALQLSLRHGQGEVVDWLVQRGCSSVGISLATLAAAGALASVQLFVDQGHDVNDANSVRRSLWRSLSCRSHTSHITHHTLHITKYASHTTHHITHHARTTHRITHHTPHTTRHTTHHTSHTTSHITPHITHQTHLASHSSSMLWGM